MRKILFILVCFFSAYQSGLGQAYEIFPYSGYTHSNAFGIQDGKANLSGGPHMGIIGTICLTPYWDFELIYSFRQALGTAESLTFSEPIKHTTQTQFATMGISRLFPYNVRYTFFTGANAGVMLLSTKDSELQSQTRLALGANAGVRYYFSEKLGLRLQVNAFLPILDQKMGLWWYSDPANPIGVGRSTAIIQPGIMAGLIIRLGEL
jgi:hypothetical protein